MERPRPTAIRLLATFRSPTGARTLRSRSPGSAIFRGSVHHFTGAGWRSPNSAEPWMKGRPSPVKLYEVPGGDWPITTCATSSSGFFSQPSRIVSISETCRRQPLQERDLSLLPHGTSGVPRGERFLDSRLVPGHGSGYVASDVEVVAVSLDLVEIDHAEGQTVLAVDVLALVVRGVDRLHIGLVQVVAVLTRLEALGGVDEQHLAL